MSGKVIAQFKPMSQREALMSAWTTANNQLVKVKKVFKEPRVYKTVDQIVKDIQCCSDNCFDTLYHGESEDHLDAVKEALDMPCYMSFHDVVNAQNLY